MPEHFTYPADMSDEIPRQTARRRWFWLIFLSPFWYFAGAGISMGDISWFGLVIAMGMTAMMAIFEFLLRRFERLTRELEGQTIEHDGLWLRQLSRDGVLIGEIDLSGPFTFSHPYSAGGNALCRVKQRREGSQKSIEFSSRINEAEHLVRDILRHPEWPPGANSA